MRNASDNAYNESKQKFCVQYFFFSFENPAVYKMMSKNMVLLGRSNMTT